MRSIRAKSSNAGKRPNEYTGQRDARRCSRPTIIFPFRRRAPRAHARHDCARRADAEKKFEGVTKIVSIIAIERIGAIVDGELRAETDVDAFAVR